MKQAIAATSQAFCTRFGLTAPVILAPMAGASPPGLSVEVAEAGGMGGCGAVLLRPAEIQAWADAVRRESAGPFQINLWVPDPAPVRNEPREAAMRRFLAAWGPEPGAADADAQPIAFDQQCEAILKVRPAVASSIMGLFPPGFVGRLKAAGIAWWATVTTLAEARAAEEAGADVLVAQGAEAGGHRGCFDAAEAEARAVGLFALLPAVADAVRVPVVAAGGIGDGRMAAACMLLGASAVQLGTAFLRCKEAGIAPAWASALGGAAPEDTVLTRAFSGRAGRSIATAYVTASTAPGAPPPAPYPVQRGLTRSMREAGVRAGDLDRLQAWAGQSARLARAEPAGAVVRRIAAELRDALA